MMQRATRIAHRLIAMGAAVVMSCSLPAEAAPTIDRLSNDAKLALDWLYRVDPSAKALGLKARAVLVFPKIAKARLIQPDKAIDASYGEGALITNGNAAEFRHFVSRSWPLERDDQSYSIVLFVMTPRAQATLAKGPWALDSDPHLAIIDETMAKPATMLKRDAYAFIFGQHGVAAVALLQSSTIFPTH